MTNDMDEYQKTGTAENDMPGAVPSGRFRLVRRFMFEIVIISVSVLAGVSLANWRGVPDRFANATSMLAQVTDVVGEAIADAVTPAAQEGKTVEIPLVPPKQQTPTSAQTNPVIQPEVSPQEVSASQPSVAEPMATSTQDDAPVAAPTESAQSTSANDAPPPLPPGSTYRLTVQLSGAGSGIVQSTDMKIVCGSDCVEDYPKNASLVLKAYSESGASFAGWSMPCSGAGSCGIVLTGDTTITAFFNSVPVQVIGTEDDPNDDRASGGTGDVLISEIKAGSESNTEDEFIELYNPTASPIALTGWSIKKKTSSGSESVFVTPSRLSGKVIPAGGYFLIVHEGLYQGGTPADATWPTSYNIAYSQNSIVLYDGIGASKETVSWNAIPVGQGYARTSWDAATFVTGAPTPRNSSFSSF